MLVLETYPQVKTFLESIGRNSKNSRKAYGSGLVHFADFLKLMKQTPDTIIPLLTKGKVNVYELLDSFVSYLIKQHISVKSLDLYMAAVRSYLMYYDIDIVPGKFRRRVKMPKIFSDPEEPLLLSDIRALLEFCNNARLTCYLLLMVSSALRPAEAASLRVRDVDFTTNPTRINVRREITKTKRGRVVYCSDETTHHLRKLLQFRKNEVQPDTLVFSIRKNSRATATIYHKMLLQFQKLQTIADKDKKKENSNRREITLHSFRRTAFTIVNEQTNSEFANWFLGHNHSVYWTRKEQERREIYKTKCMPFLTIYQESRDNSLESAAQEKERTIKLLTNRMAEKDERIEALERDNKLIKDLYKDVEILKKKLQS